MDQLFQATQDIIQGLKQISDVLQPSWEIKGWSDVSSIATAISAFLTLIVVFLTWRTVNEMVKNRIETSRPVIVVDYEVNEGIVSLFIENIGQTTAKNVIVEIPNPIVVMGYNKDVRELMFKEPIRSVPPKRKISTVISGMRRITEANGYSLKQDIKVIYDDGEGHLWDETSTLNIEIHKSTIYIEGNETKITKHLGVIAEELKEIRKVVNPDKPLEGEAALRALFGNIDGNRQE